jgi:hypothetical protein
MKHAKPLIWGSKRRRITSALVTLLAIAASAVGFYALRRRGIAEMR